MMRALSALLLMTQFGSVVHAEAGAPVRVVTLDEALGAADISLEVAMARAELRAAEAGIRGVRAPGEPTLSIVTRSVSARESVAVSFPFRWGGQRAAALSAAERDRDAAARSRERTTADARRACRIAWYTLAAGEDLLRAADDLVSRSERNRRAIAELLDQERASRLDLSRATAEAAMAAAARAGAEKTVIAAGAALRALLGYGETRLSAGALRPVPPPAGSLEDWRLRARAASPDLAVATAQLHAAEARVSQRRREKRPLASVQAGADLNNPTQPGTDALLGLAFTFPTRGRAAVEVAEADRDRAAASLELASRRLGADLETAWSATESARQRFEAIDGVARPAAAEAAELTRIAYAEGKLDLFRLLDAERALTDAEQNHADAYREWGVAYAELLRVAPEGTP